MSDPAASRRPEASSCIRLEDGRLFCEEDVPLGLKPPPLQFSENSARAM